MAPPPGRPVPTMATAHPAAGSFRASYTVRKTLEGKKATIVGHRMPCFDAGWDPSIHLAMKGM